MLSNILPPTVRYTLSSAMTRTTGAWRLQTRASEFLPKNKKVIQVTFQGQQCHQCKITGSGIGLMLVWKLVRIHKGKISIESVENKGTRVKVIFPQNNSETNRSRQKRYNKKTWHQYLLVQSLPILIKICIGSMFKYTAYPGCGRQ